MSEERKALDTILAELEALKHRHAQAEEALRRDVCKAYAAWALAEHGVKAGDVVIDTTSGAQALVDSLYYGSFWTTRPWLLARRKTKSGWAKNVTTVYHWTTTPTPPIDGEK